MLQLYLNRATSTLWNSQEIEWTSQGPTMPCITGLPFYTIHSALLSTSLSHTYSLYLRHIGFLVLWIHYAFSYTWAITLDVFSLNWPNTPPPHTHTNGDRWHYPHVFTGLYPYHCALQSYLKLPHTHNIITTISVITFPVIFFKNKVYCYLCPCLPLLLETRTQAATIVSYFFYTQKYLQNSNNNA